MAEAIEDPSMPLERNVFFRFFDLPAELRNKIYVHAFYCYPQPLQFEAVTVRGMNHMLHVNMQFRREARASYLRCTQFAFQSLPVLERFTFNSPIGADITNVTITYDPHHDPSLAVAMSRLPSLRHLHIDGWGSWGRVFSTRDKPKIRGEYLFDSYTRFVQLLPELKKLRSLETISVTSVPDYWNHPGEGLDADIEEVKRLVMLPKATQDHLT